MHNVDVITLKSLTDSLRADGRPLIMVDIVRADQFKAALARLLQRRRAHVHRIPKRKRRSAARKAGLIPAAGEW